MEESQKIEEDQQSKEWKPFVNPLDSQQEIIQKDDNVDQPSSHDDPLVQQKIIQERDDYSEQPSYRDSSEEDSNQTISEGNKYQEIKSNKTAWDEDNENIMRVQEQIVQKDEKDQRVSSHSAQWSSEKEMEGYEQQILQMVEQRHESERQHQPVYSWDSIKEDQGLFVSLMNRYNELQKKMDQLDRQRSESLCSGCGLLKSNLARKIISGAALHIYFCAQCDSNYEIIPK